MEQPNNNPTPAPATPLERVREAEKRGDFEGHTGGRWEYMPGLSSPSDEHPCRHVIAANGVCRVDVLFRNPPHPMGFPVTMLAAPEVDYRLMAAAPDLLAAFRTLEARLAAAEKALEMAADAATERAIWVINRGGFRRDKPPGLSGVGVGWVHSKHYTYHPLESRDWMFYMSDSGSHQWWVSGAAAWVPFTDANRDAAWAAFCAARDAARDVAPTNFAEADFDDRECGDK